MSLVIHTSMFATEDATPHVEYSTTVKGVIYRPEATSIANAVYYMNPTKQTIQNVINAFQQIMDSLPDEGDNDE